MLKTLKIEVAEVLGAEIVDTQLISNSNAGSTLVETETEIFFLLDSHNYKSFCNYFSIQLDDTQTTEIYEYFK